MFSYISTLYILWIQILNITKINYLLGYFFSFNVIFLILDESNGTTQEENKPLEINFESAPNISVGFRLASYKQGISCVYILYAK